MVSKDRIAVFGGGGFLGKRIVARLVQRGRRVLICERNPPARAATRGMCIAVRTCDIRDRDAVRHAMWGCGDAINCVGLYRESLDREHRDEHVLGARNVAEVATELRLRSLVHMSVMGADPGSDFDVAEAEGRAEVAVRQAFTETAILRPSIMFGEKDGFISRLVRIISQVPAMPIPSPSDAGVQPIYVEDVAEAVTAAGSAPVAAGANIELAGPETYTFLQIVRLIGFARDCHPHLFTLPIGAWSALGWATSWLKEPLFTPAQLELFRRGTRPDPGLPGLAALKIEPVSLRSYISNDVQQNSPQRGLVNVG